MKLKGSLSPGLIFMGSPFQSNMTFVSFKLGSVISSFNFSASTLPLSRTPYNGATTIEGKQNVPCTIGKSGYCQAALLNSRNYHTSWLHVDAHLILTCTHCCVLHASALVAISEQVAYHFGGILNTKVHGGHGAVRCRQRQGCACLQGVCWIL